MSSTNSKVIENIQFLFDFFSDFPDFDRFEQYLMVFRFWSVTKKCNIVLRNRLIISELKRFFRLQNSVKDSLNQNFGQILKLSSPSPTELEILPGWFH